MNWDPLSEVISRGTPKLSNPIPDEKHWQKPPCSATPRQVCERGAAKRNHFRPATGPVNAGEEMCKSLGRRQRSNKVNVQVTKPSRRHRNIQHW
ncbi:hypothetical protein PoB_001141300 [Plakobranchus ocellatus]|uniref:Uncharacterized protein n=1 Tax=Plakobranchus ocellatus TaxID=259542 RepID=A0AAV3YRJ2_9GAST|nr:hypothetical protein PoB_001141300 [Plakobranchus ocellatus]